MKNANSWPVGKEQGQRFCISHKLPGNVNAAGPVEQEATSTHLGCWKGARWWDLNWAEPLELPLRGFHQTEMF